MRLLLPSAFVCHAMRLPVPYGRDFRSSPLRTVCVALCLSRTLSYANTTFSVAAVVREEQEREKDEMYVVPLLSLCQGLARSGENRYLSRFEEEMRRIDEELEDSDDGDYRWV